MRRLTAFDRGAFDRGCWLCLDSAVVVVRCSDAEPRQRLTRARNQFMARMSQRWLAYAQAQDPREHGASSTPEAVGTLDLELLSRAREARKRHRSGPTFWGRRSAADTVQSSPSGLPDSQRAALHTVATTQDAGSGRGGPHAAVGAEPLRRAPAAPVPAGTSEGPANDRVDVFVDADGAAGAGDFPLPRSATSAAAAARSLTLATTEQLARENTRTSKLPRSGSRASGGVYWRMGCARARIHLLSCLLPQVHLPDRCPH